MKIHPTSIIEDGAIIGENVTIGPFCLIGKDVKIGKNTVLESHIVIEGITEIGENNMIYSFVSLGKPSPDLKYKNEDTKTIIGNNNILREYVSVHRGTADKWETRIGNGNLFMTYSHVSHDSIVGDRCILANGVTLAGHVEVGNNVVIGGLTPIHQFCRVGSYAMVGGASAINQDICPFILAEGNKAKTRGLNTIGLRRNNFTDQDIKNLKRAYKIIFRQKLLLNDAVREVSKIFPEDENIKYLLKFISGSNRGITR